MICIYLVTNGSRFHYEIQIVHCFYRINETDIRLEKLTNTSYHYTSERANSAG